MATPTQKRVLITLNWRWAGIGASHGSNAINFCCFYLDLLVCKQILLHLLYDIRTTFNKFHQLWFIHLKMGLQSSTYHHFKTGTLSIRFINTHRHDLYPSDPRLFPGPGGLHLSRAMKKACLDSGVGIGSRTSS